MRTVTSLAVFLGLAAGVAMAQEPSATRVEQAPGTPVPAQGDAADSPAEDTPLATSLPSEAPPVASFVPEQQQGELLSSDLIGHPVFDTAGTRLGEVTDMLIDSDRRLSALIVSTGSGADTDRKSIGIPFESVRQASGQGGEIQLIIDLDQAKLDTATAFEPLSEEASMDDTQDAMEGSTAEGGSTPLPQ